MTNLKIKALSLLLALGISSSVFSATVYYSVGTSTSDLKNASNITVSGTTATFTAAQPNNVGLGDQISYGSSPNDTCYITGRTSSTVYSVMSKNGGTPNARSGVAVNTIKRAFNSLSGAESGATDAAHMNTANLVTGGFILQIACYGDGEDAITGFLWDGYTTGASNYIRIFTPVSSTEVGTSQRHNGTWSTSAYRIRDTNGGYGFQFKDNYTFMEGIQYQCDLAASVANYGLYLETASYCKVMYCIIRADTTNAATATSCGGIYAYNETGFEAYSNIVYDFRGTSGSYAGGILGYARMTIYGNTIVRCKIGISNVGGTSQNVKNNIVQKCGTAYSTTFNEETYNISDQASGLNGTNSKNSTTVAFVDSTGTPRDLHLQSSDTQAKDAGTDLSSYYTQDIDGTTRSGTWDIGADETPDNSAPNAPTIDNYNDGAWGTDATPTFQFDLSDPNSGDIVKYQIQIDDNSNFASTVVDVTEGSGSAEPRSNVTYTPSSLTAGQYYWRVRGIDDDAATGNWATANGGAVAFGVDVTAPTNVGCSTPANSATDVSRTPILTALTATDGSGSGLHSSGGYYFELATNTSFTTGTQNSGWQSGTTWIPTILTATTTYYWRVKARDNAANQSSQCGHTADNAGYGTFTTGTGSGAYPTWTYSDTLYFNTTSTGANVSSNQTNFPVLVRLTRNNFAFSQAQNDGDDLRFADPDQTALDFEIERYDSTNGVAEIWVEVPQVAGNSSTDYIVMFWGNSGATAASNPEATFATANSFAGVWHLNESGDNTGEDFIDATSNSNDGTGGGGTAANVPAQATGIIGKGQLYDNTDNIRIDDHATIEPSQLTVSGWMKPTTDIAGMTGVEYPGICWKDDYAGGKGYGLGNCITGMENTFSFRLNGNVDKRVNKNVTDNNTWVYLTGKYDGANLVIYRNATDSSTPLAWAGPISYGTEYMYLGWLVGTLDEVRLENTARSPSWIKLCYENQKAAQTLIKYPLRTLYYSVGTTATAMYNANASASNGTLTLASAAVDSVGVGDEIRLGSNRYYIRGRNSSTSFKIQNSAANGGTPGDTVITFSSQSITIYRAFNSLNAAVSYDASSAGDASHMNTADLAANNYVLNIACYADGIDATAAVVSGWTTGASNYIRIYTPTSSGEVGKTQRHAGVWSDSKYNITVSNASALTNDDATGAAYLRIEGIQVRVSSASATNHKGIYTGSKTADVRISNSICRGSGNNAAQTYHTGIELWTNSATPGTLKVWNNIVYDWKTQATNTGIGIYSQNTFSVYVYNNTVYNCSYGIYADNGADNTTAKNNLVYSCTDNYGTNGGSGTFTGTNNLSGSGADADMPNTGERDGVNVTFADSANDNFHLSNSDAGAKDYGTDLSADTYIPFNTDIDGATRQGTWDIGAHEAAPATNIYYSVGTRTSSLYSSPAQADNGSLALYYPASDSVGVGDEVRVGSARYYICKRYSSSRFNIQRAALGGGTPGATDINFTMQDITIYRAFNCLDSAVHANRAGTLNRASDANHLNTANLVTGNYILNIGCYGDGADNVMVLVDGWTTGASNYIRIFTPVTTSEVGTTQRHNGKWSTSAYRLEVTGAADWDGCLQIISPNHARVDGLQAYIMGSGASYTFLGICAFPTSNSADIHLSNNIVKANFTGSISQAWGLGVIGDVTNHATATARIWNNIVYNFNQATSVKNCGIALGYNLPGNMYVSNNTVANCNYGFFIDNSGYTNLVTAKNNIVQKASSAANAYYYNTGSSPWQGACTYNLSDLATAPPGTNPQTSKVVLFVDSSAAGRDFHLSGSDAVARNVGTDLSADANLSFSTDIDGNTRAGTWDIGADESYSTPTAIYYSVGTTATALYSGTGSATSGVLTITTSSASNTIGLGDEVRQGSNEYYIRSRSSSTSFGIQTPTGGTSITFADGAITIYRAFNSLSAAENGATGANYLNTADLVTGNYQLNIVCYGDGADATALTVDGYTTSANNYIRIFTPTAATEVGTTQRHVGNWAASNVYTLAYNGTSQALAIADEFVRVEGLQISVTTAAAGGPNGIYFNPGATPNDIRVGYNIIKGVLSASATSAEGIQCNASGTYKIYNNLVYDFTDPSNDHTGIAFGAGATVTAYVYNNTVQGSYTGIARTVGTIIAKNNLTQSCTDGFNGTFDATSDYNISDVASDAPGSHSKNSATALFVNAGSDSFHLQSTDTVARRSGTDLSSDTYLPFSDDIDTKTRFGSWDIGADQYWDVPDLAVSMDAFFAKGGDGNDTISWRTQSEKDNYGFNIFRRIKPAFWQAKMAEDGLTVNSYQLTAGIEGRRAKNGKTPDLSDGSTVHRSPLTVNSPDTLTVNRSPLTVNLFKDRFDNDTTWKQVNIGIIPGAKGGRSVGPRSYRIIDYGVENGITYEYTIEDIDYSSVRIRHGIAEATPNKRLPGTFALHPNYPNPFNPITVVQYDLPKTCRVDISVFDLRGRKIVTLVAANQVKEPGFYKIAWTGKDIHNRPVASGIYLCRMQTENFVRLRRMTLLK